MEIEAALFWVIMALMLVIVKLFSMTVHISQLESRQRELIQKMALEKRFKEEEEEMKDGDERRTAGTVSEQVQ